MNGMKKLDRQVALVGTVLVVVGASMIWGAGGFILGVGVFLIYTALMPWPKGDGDA